MRVRVIRFIQENHVFEKIEKAKNDTFENKLVVEKNRRNCLEIHPCCVGPEILVAVSCLVAALCPVEVSLDSRFRELYHRLVQQVSKMPTMPNRCPIDESRHLPCAKKSLCRLDSDV